MEFGADYPFEKKAPVNYFQKDLEKSLYHDQYLISTVDNSLFACDTSLMNTLDIARRYSTTDTLKLDENEELRELGLKTHDEIFEELLDLLEGYNKKYTKMLIGSEEALKSEHEDSKCQATHSMRDLFQQFLEENAPNIILKDLAWFEETKGAPGGVSRRSRLKYFIYGNCKNINERILGNLDQIVNDAKTTLDIAQEYAHNHSIDIDLDTAKSIIDKIRSSRIEAINLHTEYFTN